MLILTPQGQFDTSVDAVVFMFNDDNELNEFLTKMAQFPVKTAGLRLIPFIPQNMELTPMQEQLFEVIGNLDGIGRHNELTYDVKLDDSMGIIRHIIG